MITAVELFQTFFIQQILKCNRFLKGNSNFHPSNNFLPKSKKINDEDGTDERTKIFFFERCK